MLICIPITVDSVKSAVKDIKEASKIADIIELRLDYISDINVDNLDKLFVDKKLPFIVTCRLKSQGGKYEDDEDKRFELFKKAISLGVEYVDVELHSGLVDEMIRYVNDKHTQVIVSHHDFSMTPNADKLYEIYQLVSSTECDVVKIVCYANSLTDNLSMFELLRKVDKETIAFCMGELGEISRILCLMHGGMLTFGSLRPGKESAPGQLTATVLKDVYRVMQLNPSWKIYGVVGNPVRESKSYLIHNTAFKELTLKKVFIPFLVDNIQKFLSDFDDVISGLAVTMPWKEDVIKFIDETDPVAGKIGAVNTVVKRNGKLIGYNTDVSGAIVALQDCLNNEGLGKIKGKKILLVGAGGAARAIAHGIVTSGGELMIVNRTASKAKSLAKELNCKCFRLDDLDNVFDKGVDIVINSTSIGMEPNVDESIVPVKYLTKNMVVFDAVYNPANTKLLKDAKKKGCFIVSGVEMFINQAAEQFKLWTEKNAPVEIMRASLLKELK